ncbi:hypothetical protein ACFYO0_46190 [Streptomyces sp. NPDC006365]|uniref:hypothetical protein n=1 Tax=Streptomyces sp. NPDC006365 TaxID=3364744 RepID=UPI00367D5DEE
MDDSGSMRTLAVASCRGLAIRHTEPGALGFTTPRLAHSLDEAICSNEFWPSLRRIAARAPPRPDSLTTHQAGSTTYCVRALTSRQEMVEALGLQKAREMIERRDLLVAGAAGGTALVLPGSKAAAALPNGTAVAPRAGSAGKFPVPTLDPTTIPKYVTNLVIPPVMPKARHSHRHGIDTYVIGVRQFSQQVLPPTLPSTTVWGYGSLADNNTFNYPSFTIEARVSQPVRVTWVNDLVDGQGRFLPHLLAVDPTLHWANPPGGKAGRDSRPTFTSTPGPYTGPVPIVTHLHGGIPPRRATATPRRGICPARTTFLLDSPPWARSTTSSGRSSPMRTA